MRPRRSAVVAAALLVALTAAASAVALPVPGAPAPEASAIGPASPGEAGDRLSGTGTTVPGAVGTTDGEAATGLDGGPAGSASGATVGGSVDGADRPDPAVVVRINLTESGDARWTVASRFDLEGEDDVAAFRAFADDVRSGEVSPAVGYSPATFERFAARVEAATDRQVPMRIENAEWTDRVENGTGVLALSFTWVNFARVEGDGSRVVLSDVFEADGGEWFSELDDGQVLVVNAPPGYTVTEYTLQVPFRNGRVRIEGPVNLSQQEVTIAYEPTTAPTTTTPTPAPGTATPTRTTPGNQQGETSLAALIGGGLAVVAVVFVGAYAVVRRRDRESVPPGDGGAGAGAGAGSGGEDAGPGSETGAGDGTGAGASETAGGPEPDDGSVDAGAGATADGEPATGPGSGGSGANGGTTAAGTAASGPEATDATESTDTGDAAASDAEEGDAEDDDGIDEELLSDEERVERLLRQNGGRMKQASIVSETGWSNAKVSQLLSSMDEDNRIDKLRIGRENLIALPDEDVGEID